MHNGMSSENIIISNINNIICLPLKRDQGESVSDDTTNVGMAIKEENTDVSHHANMIKEHPLFPLLSMLFEKCEQAMLFDDVCTTEKFNSLMHTYLNDDRQQGSSSVTGESEDVNDFVLMSIEVLRIHLLELEKVSELCDNFCSRYIQCLRSKISSDSFLRDVTSEDVLESDDDDDDLDKDVDEDDVDNREIEIGKDEVPLDCSMISGNPPILGSTPLSQISVPPLTLTTTGGGGEIIVDGDGEEEGEWDEMAVGEGMEEGRVLCLAGKRGVLPKRATNMLRSWLFQHIAHPYPTEEEKKELSGKTGLTLLQVNNWFINARRRILQPMLENTNTHHMADTAHLNPTSTIVTSPSNLSNLSSSSLFSTISKQRKNKSHISKSSVERFWPQSLADTIQSGIVKSALALATTVPNENYDVSASSAASIKPEVLEVDSPT